MVVPEWKHFVYYLLHSPQNTHQPEEHPADFYPGQPVLDKMPQIRTVSNGC